MDELIDMQEKNKVDCGHSSGIFTMSQKSRVVSVWAMFTVVMIHSNTLGTFPDAANWNVFIQRLLTRALSDWAVPFFFLGSGFWYAKGNSRRRMGGYGHLLKKKVNTLLVPYVLWSVLGAFLSMPVILFNNHVRGLPLLSRTFLGQHGIWAKIDHLIGITTSGPSGNLALWFLRTLIFLFIFTPLWNLMLRYLGKWGLLVLGMFLAVLSGDFKIPYIHLQLSAIGWFMAGMALTRTDILAKSWKSMWILLPCGAVYVFLGVYMALRHQLPFNLIPVFGFAFFWALYDFLPAVSWPGTLLKSTFWVYCMHGSIMGYFLAGGVFLLGKTNVTTFFIMLLSPFLALAFCLACRAVLLCCFPAVYEILNGGRNAGDKESEVKKR